MRMTKYVIVGGVAGGASAAARLRRLDETAEIVLVERGEHVSYANCGLPYYAGGVIQERDRKSTRVNSSHSSISYAVFCLTKPCYSLGYVLRSYFLLFELFFTLLVKFF